jgi:hypothetical protein
MTEPELTEGIAELFTTDERAWFSRALDALREREIPFVIAGAFGVYHYTGFWRGTKDLDVLILEEHRQDAVAAACSTGLCDMLEKEPYDPGWIFRATRDDLIVDLIWRLPNGVGKVERDWMQRASPARFLGAPVGVTSAADLIWMKLFVLQRERCDWPDIVNIIRGTEGRLDWEHLLGRVGPHAGLLQAALTLYDWLCPGERSFIPEGIRERLHEMSLNRGSVNGACRNDLLDSRPWFAAAGAFRRGR